MEFTRRKLFTTTLAASAAVGLPHLWVPGSKDAWAATPAKGEPLKVGVLFSLTGALAVPEEDSTLVLQYAFDEINKAGGVGAHVHRFLLSKSITGEQQAIAQSSIFMQSPSVRSGRTSIPTADGRAHS